MLLDHQGSLVLALQLGEEGRGKERGGERRGGERGEGREWSGEGRVGEESHTKSIASQSH